MTINMYVKIEDKGLYANFDAQSIRLAQHMINASTPDKCMHIIPMCMCYDSISPSLTSHYVVGCNCQHIDIVPNIPSIYPLLLQYCTFFIFSMGIVLFSIGCPKEYSYRQPRRRIFLGRLEIFRADFKIIYWLIKKWRPIQRSINPHKQAYMVRLHQHDHEIVPLLLNTSNLR